MSSAAARPRDPRHIAIALLSAVALAFVFATHVATGFHGARVKAVTSPVQSSGGVAQVALPASAGAPALQTPFALILRIHSDGEGDARFTVSLDGRTVCTPEIRGGTARRIDCAVTGPWDAQASHVLEIAGPASGVWTLTYVELATHHGASRGYDLIVAPAGSVAHARPGVAGIAIAGVVSALVFLLPAAAWPRAARRIHAAARVLALLLFVLVLTSNWFSPYLLLLSQKAFWALAAIVAAPRVWTAVRLIWGGAPATTRRRAIASVATGAVVLGAYWMVVAQRLETGYGGNYSGLLHISRTMFDRHPDLASRDDVRQSLILVETGGYDAQFMYFMTFDPLLRVYGDRPGVYDRFIDAPPYRYGRIGYSLLTKLLAGTRWQAYPRVMIWTLLASLLLCGAAIGSLAQLRDGNAAWGLLVILIPGFWQSVQFGLPEPIAAALLLAGFLLVRRRWIVAGAVLFAASLLVRETGGVLVAATAAGLWLSRRRRDAVLLLVVAVVPVVAWRLYVGVTLAPQWGAQAYWFDPENLGVPFGGIADLWRTAAQGAYYPEMAGMTRAAIGLTLLLGAALVLAAAAAVARPGVLTVSAVLYAVMAVSLTYSSIWIHVGNAQRGTYEVFVVLALLSIGGRELPRALRVALAMFWVAAGAYSFFGAYDADFVRNALL